MNWAEYVTRYYKGHTLPIAVTRVILEVDRLNKEGKTVAEILKEFDDNWFFASQQLKANIDCNSIQAIIDTLQKRETPKITTTTY